MFRYLILGLVFALSFISCSEKEQKNEDVQMDQSIEMKNQSHVGIIKEKLDAREYSYLFVEENNNSYWIAVPKTDLQPGESVYYSEFMEMKDFRSETLDKTFETVLFVQDARAHGNMDQNINNPHEQSLSSIEKENVQIEKAKDGYTIEELYSNKTDLENKTVKVAGKVVKANLGIMNRNWFHIQDGTGEKGSHDLTLISDDVVEVGEQVEVEGTLVKDKDFGSGYFYPLVIENAKIKSK